MVLYDVVHIIKGCIMSNVGTLGSFFPIFFFDFRQFYRKLSRLTVQKKIRFPRYLRYPPLPSLR